VSLPTARTLVEALEHAATLEGAGHSHRSAAKGPSRFVSYAQIHASASRIAAALQQKGLAKGDRVGVIVPESEAFIETLFGAMMAGLIPVPVYPPMNLGKFDNYLDNTTHILRKSGCGVVITDQRVRPILGKLVTDAPEIREVVTHEALVASVEEGTRHEAVDVTPDDIAFLQFTSGSTNRPKGVSLTHGNLLANVLAIGGPDGLKLVPEDVAISWLPLYHDMGLIGFVFTPLVFGVLRCAYISPLLFLKRPAVWLRETSELGGTISFAPNFAWGLATRRIKDREIEGVDLSTLRVAGCGAEPIDFDTLSGFADRFEAYGFDRRAFLPCYGMAEHSLAITFVGLEEMMRYDLVQTDALADGEATPAEHGADPKGPGVTRVVDCGRRFPAHDIRIVGDAGEGDIVTERKVGEIQLLGPSITAGYFGDEEATAGAFTSDGWLRTGDLGYLADERLFVCGRTKDLIIIHGRNYYPQDIEVQASRCEGVRTGNVIAFGFHDADVDRERVVVLAESRAPEEESPQIRDAVRARVLESMNLKVDEVLVLPPGSLPKTSSGKLQRAKAKKMFQDQGIAAPQGGRWNLIKHLAQSRWSYIKATFK
jgi:fatty-acyl-CoA synthase